MSFDVPVSFQDKFKDDFMLLSQQRGSKLLSWTDQEPDFQDGRSGFFDRIGATSVQEKTNRHADTPLISTPHSRRKFWKREFEWADLIDKGDVRRMLRSPQNKYVTNATYAFGRRQDDDIITAALGNATSVDEDGNEAQVPLPASQVIVHGGVGMTLAKMKQAAEIMLDADVDEFVRKVMAIGPKQVTDILGITESNSIEFNAMKPLVDGKVVHFMGFDLVPITRLPKTGTTRGCVAFTEMAIGYGGDEQPFVDIGPRRDKSLATQVYLQTFHGATRKEEVQVVEIECTET